jgi:hypothetical protein
MKWTKSKAIYEEVGLSTERRFATDEEVRARRARMRRRLKTWGESIERRQAMVDEWRREGLLPPEEPRRRI